ncbi:ABC transporter permease [Fusibacter ferrireducens]|uniref:ABC transporter permease n=1 Tax=Fusibacter ferrireducens TaxID=2785058 RepID=A0ABR9ZXD2_9FIRM|nr:ABC transporter permease [Fusibacter ferrireducens]MBF4695114.1 ABC transporter permease [Fusibacter ferrireducens]
MVQKSFLEELNRFEKEKILFIVLFIIPILSTFILGIAFSSEVIDHIPMAVVDYDHTDFSRKLINAFSDNDAFDVIYYPENDRELEALMRDSKVRVSMVIPHNFYNDVQQLKSPTVLMAYDGSHMSMTSVSKSKSMEILLTYKAGATINHLQSRLNLSYDEAFNITQAFHFSNRMFYNPNKSFKDFLTPPLMAGVVQASIVLTATVSIDHKIYQKNRRQRRGYALGKTLFYALAGTLSMIFCIIIQAKVFHVAFIGNIADALILTLAYTFAVSSFCVLISAIISNRMISLIGGGVIFIPNSIMAGTTWPLYAMPIGYQCFAKYVPFMHYIINLRDIYLKGISLATLKGDLIYLALFSCIVIIITESVLFIADVEIDKDQGKEASDGIYPELQSGISMHI